MLKTSFSCQIPFIDSLAYVLFSVLDPDLYVSQLSLAELNKVMFEVNRFLYCGTFQSP